MVPAVKRLMRMTSFANLTNINQPALLIPTIVALHLAMGTTLLRMALMALRALMDLMALMAPSTGDLTDPTALLTVLVMVMMNLISQGQTVDRRIYTNKFGILMIEVL